MLEIESRRKWRKQHFDDHIIGLKDIKMIYFF